MKVLISILTLGLLVACYGQDVEGNSSTTTAASNTTVSSTTGAPNTTTVSNTTVAPTNHSTTGSISTTSPKPPGAPTYAVMDVDGNNTCLLLRANIDIAFNAGSAKALKNMSIPSSAHYNGMCSDKENQITFYWNNSDVGYTLTLKFAKSGYDYSLSDVLLNYTINGNTTTANDSPKDTMNSGLGTYYHCTAGVAVTVGIAHLNISYIEVQPFMNYNRKISNFDSLRIGNDCTYPSGTPKYVVKDKGHYTCLLLEAHVYTAFPYTSGKDKSVNITVPKYALTTGNCSKTSDKISFNYIYGPELVLDLTIMFNKSDSDYSLSNVYFKYTAGDASKSWSDSFHDELTTAVHSSYNCTAGLTLKVKDMNLTLTNLRVGAFMNDSSSSPSFEKVGQDCSYQGKTDAIVPIAVGAALAAMVLIVLIGYCIGRRRAAASNNYQTMSSEE